MVVLRTAVLLAALLALPASAGAQQGTYQEHDVKAAFLYNFTKFVEWPPEAFRSPESPMAICVFGEDPFGESLDAVVRGETLNGRRLVVRRTRDLQELRDCQTLFVPGAERERFAEVFSALRDASVLTVGEVDGFLPQGGVIRFVVDQGRVRFEINLDAAERSRLKLSSKLLRLARAVYPQH